jgi:hypothetical protein
MVATRIPRADLVSPADLGAQVDLRRARLRALTMQSDADPLFRALVLRELGLSLMKDSPVHSVQGQAVLVEACETYGHQAHFERLPGVSPCDLVDEQNVRAWVLRAHVKYKKRECDEVYDACMGDLGE